MSVPFVLRETTGADAAVLAALAEAAPDGGAVTFRVRTHVPSGWDPATTAVGVLAELPGVPGAIGAARLTMGTCHYLGEARPYVLLSSLVVHPDHRRRGVAAALTGWLIDRARELGGPRVVILATIQRGNTASLANARRWEGQAMAPVLTVPLPMRSRPPRATAGLTVRDAVPEDLPAIAVAAEAAALERDLSRVWTLDALTRWLAASPFDDPVHHYRVAVDRDGVIVAGLALAEDGRLRSLEVTRMPAAIRLANRLLHVVPVDGVMRNLVADHLWFAPGRLDAAAALWEDTRWTWRDRGSSMLVTIDERDPVRAALGVRPWSPTTRLVTVVGANPAPDIRRLVSPPV